VARRDAVCVLTANAPPSAAAERDASAARAGCVHGLLALQSLCWSSTARQLHELRADSAVERSPGVHVAYELSPLKLRVLETRAYSARQFAYRLLSIGSNLFIVGQIVDRVLQLALRLFARARGGRAATGLRRASADALPAHGPLGAPLGS